MQATEMLSTTGKHPGAFLFVAYASIPNEIVNDLTLNGFAGDYRGKEDL